MHLTAPFGALRLLRASSKTEVVPFPIYHMHGTQALSESSAFGTLETRRFDAGN
jgi:hypothetical protein